jgi:DNA-binding LytR/AlgR family response regulator
MIINDISTKKYFFWFSFVLILLFTFLEPAGTSEASFFERLFIWTLQISILVPSLIAFHIALQQSTIFERLNDWLKILLSGLLGCIFFLPFSLGLDYVMELDDWSQIQTLTQAQNIIFEEMGGVFAPVLLTWAGMNAPRILQLDFSNVPLSQPVEAIPPNVTADEANDATPPSESEFIAKFSKLIGTDIIYMMSELHYVRVVTSKGETLVLHNLKDAIAELSSAYNGIQTHRSYWAALKHIDSMKEKKGQSSLALSIGKTIPVSRRKLSEVKAFLAKQPECI